MCSWHISKVSGSNGRASSRPPPSGSSGTWQRPRLRCCDTWPSWCLRPRCPMAAIGKSLKLISALCGKNGCWLSERVLGHVHPNPFYFFSPPFFFFSFLFLSFLTSLLSLSHFSSHFWSHFLFWSSGFGGIIFCTSWVPLKIGFIRGQKDKQATRGRSHLYYTVSLQ